MRFAVVGLVIALAAAPVWAEPLDVVEKDIAPPPSGEPVVIDELAMKPLPLPIQKEGDITYITGGVGIEELTMLREHDKEFNTQILFSDKKGAYLSQLSVHIFGGDGEPVLVVENAGPYLYTQLAPGRYAIEASSGEFGTKKRSFTVPKQGITKPVMQF